MVGTGEAPAVELRPVEEDDLPVLEQLTQDPEGAGEFEWFGWRDLRRYRKEWAENGLIGPESGTLLVVRHAERLGFVVWRRHSASPNSFYFEIGIGLLPEARGHGYGTAAQRLLAEYLFAHTPVQRIEAATEADNVGEQRALEKAGFTREGVHRSVGWRAGAWRDGVWYSLLRSDLDGVSR
jgi:RimJ/RimL family protein N-acetyltransferase